MFFELVKLWHINHRVQFFIDTLYIVLLSSYLTLKIS